jgi:DNA-binding transcriptional regulator YhcF (GntR family)
MILSNQIPFDLDNINFKLTSKYLNKIINLKNKKEENLPSIRKYARPEHVNISRVNPLTC